MRKVLLLCVLILLLAVSLKPGDLTGITGFLIQTGSTLVTIARFVLKQVLTFVVKVL
jgi:hypothetical protein